MIKEFQNIRYQDLAKVAQELVAIFLQNDQFVVWLYGELGAGKTTLTGAILHALGIKEDVAILSPTFTYMNEYSSQHGLWAHLDLYRCDDDFSLDELGILDEGFYRGIFIEWPEKSRDIYKLPADFFLTILHNKDDTRTIRLLDEKPVG